MSDAGNPRPSNGRPRPLGEVKAERVCFDTPSDYRPWAQGGAVAFPLGGASATTPPGGAAEGPRPGADGDTGKAPSTVRGTPPHNTATVQTSSRNEPREDNGAQTSPRADNAATVTLLTSLVSNRMRSISIPKRQIFDIPGPVIQCSMAPTSNVDNYYESSGHSLVESPEMNVPINSPDSLAALKSLHSPDEGRSMLLSDHDNLSIGTPTRSGYGARDGRGPSRNRDQRGGFGQWGMRMGQRQKRHLTTSRRKEMVKRLSEVSKCDAIDIMDSEVHKDHSASSMPPMIIMSNKKDAPPTREKTMPINGDGQLSRTQSISSLAYMKKKRRSICSNDGSISVRGCLELQRENSGFFQSEKFFGGIVGKGFDHKQAMALGKSMPQDTYSGLAPMRHPQMPKGRLLSHSGVQEEYRGSTLAHNIVLRNPPIPAIRRGATNRPEEISLEGRNLQTPRSNTMLTLPMAAPASRRATRQDGERTYFHADIDEHLIDKLNHKFDELQKQISLTLQRPGAYWTQPDPTAGMVPKAKSSSSRDAANWSSRTTSSASVDASENPSTGVTPRQSPVSRLEGRDESMATCLETAKMAARMIEERARSSRLGEGRSQRASRANSRLGSGTSASDVVDEDGRGRDTERQIDKEGERERERDRDLRGGLPALHRSMTVPEDTLCSRMANAEAKDQGSTSKVNEMETSSQIHVIACKHLPAESNKYKVLKALDQEVYSDFQHKKYRKNGHTVLGKIDKPRIHLLKINLADQE